jgi:hypothetical protein
MLSESIKTFRQPVYVRTKRNTESYSATTEFITSNLIRLTELYKVSSGLQRLRLIRDEMDHNLRRYHGYTIKGSIGAHYKQVGITKGIFEHMVPASTIRDLVLAEVITPHQACNMPTCTLSKENDQLLKDAGLNSTTPDIYNFWLRYKKCFNTINQFETYDGTAILTSEWTLDNHFDYFG